MAFGRHQRLRRLAGLAHQLGEFDARLLQGDLAARDARDVQQFVHQAGEMGDLALDDVSRPLHARLLQI